MPPEPGKSGPPRRWVGIDEAGYGPNLGPLVMTAVLAEGPGDRPPDLWGDLPATICRAGGPRDRLWIDDSKAIYRARKGRERLEAACLAAFRATGGARPTTLGDLLGGLGAGSLAQVELEPWLNPDEDPPLSGADAPSEPFRDAPWSIVALRSVVVGPARFQAGLERSGSKAAVHFEAFAELLRWVWGRGDDGVPTELNADKHGGRHFYGGPLAHALPDGWIAPGAEGPELSRYAIRGEGRDLTVSLRPRADADDGLVALASIVSKYLRERWMDVFNDFWTSRVPGLKPTAGYPVDAARFRAAIEPHARALGLPPALWWRAK